MFRADASGLRAWNNRIDEKFGLGGNDREQKRPSRNAVDVTATEDSRTSIANLELPNIEGQHVESAVAAISRPAIPQPAVPEETE